MIRPSAPRPGLLARVAAFVTGRAESGPGMLAGAASSAEVEVVDRGEGRITLLARGDAARRSVAETANRLEELGPARGLPRLVRFKEGRRAARLDLEVGEAVALGAALSPGFAAARALVASLLEVVERLHARGHVLGDLPPGSVCVRPDGEVVLLLLAPPCGVAPSPRASAEVLRGMPPEPRDDVHSVAAVLVELLTGLPSPAALHDELSRVFARASVHAGLERLLVRSLGPREGRPRSIAELRSALDDTPWRAGFAAELHDRLRALRAEHRLDALDRRREWLFLERVTAPDVGDLAVVLRSRDLLELSFAPDGGRASPEGAFIETGQRRVLGTVRRGRALLALEAIDLRELAQHGLWLRTAAGGVHDLSAAKVHPAPRGTRPEVLAALAAWARTRGPDAAPILLLGRTELALEVLATDALLAALAVPDQEGGPPADIRARVEEEVARRILSGSGRLRPGSASWAWLDSVLGPADPARAALLRVAPDEPDGALEKLASSPGRFQGVARRLVEGAPRAGHAVWILSATGEAPGLASGSATRARIAAASTAPSAPRAVSIATGDAPAPDLVRAVERAADLANALLGTEGTPLVELDVAPWDARLATVPLFVAMAVARSGRRPLPRSVALAAPLNEDGRLEALGAALPGALEAALASGVRLLFVPHGDVEAAQRVRAEKGVDARDMAIAGLPELSPRELFQTIDERTAEHFPAQLVLDRAGSRSVLERAREQIAAGRPDLALFGLAFLLRTLARPRTRAAARLRATCLAEIARCRNARGQWRLALEACRQAEGELERLGAARDLDWEAAGLLYELPGQRAACLLHAFAFDVAEKALEDDLRAKEACALVSNDSLARSHGTLGRLELERGIAAGERPERAERFARARTHLLAALEKIDDDERPRHLNWLGHLESCAGNLAAAERRYDEASLAAHDAARADGRLDADAADLGRVIVDIRRGRGGDRDAFEHAHAAARAALARGAHAPLFRGRLVRCAGVALLEAGDLVRARTTLLESRALFDAIADAGSFLNDALPDLELARLEHRAGHRSEASRWLGEALARLAAFRAQIVGISAFASAFVGSLEKSLEKARDAGPATELFERELDEVLGRIPAF